LCCSSIILDGLGSSLVVEGAAIISAVFETHVERILVPTLRGDQVIVMDNPNAHKGEGIRELIEERRCELVYLLPH
jgi:transposase